MAARSSLGLSLLLAVSAACLFIAGCGEGAGPVTAETSQFKPVDSTTKTVTNDEPANLTSPPGIEPTQPLVDPAAPRTTTEGTPAGKPKAEIATSGRPAATPTKSPPPGKAPSAAPPPPADPNGDEIEVTPEIAQIFDLMDQLKASEPMSNAPEDQLQHLILVRRQLVELSSKVLGMKADARVHRIALQQAQLALAELAQLRDPSAITRMTLFAEGVSKHPTPEIARHGRLMSFNVEIIDKLQGAEKIDGEALLKKIQDLLDKDGGDVETFRITTSVCQILSERGETETAAKAMRAISTAFKDSTDADLAQAAKALPDSARVVELNIPQQISDILDKKDGAEGKLVTGVEALLAEKNPNPIFIQPIMDVLKVLEQVNLTATSLKLVGILETAYSGHENAGAAKFVAEQIVEPSRKRYALVGQDFKPDVVTADGKVLDMAEHKGKVLLVAIWGTVAQTSLEEMPVLRNLHESLSDKGFEVIGLDVDIDLKRLEQFMRFQRSTMPYGNYLSPEVVGGEKLKDWHESSIAKQFGLQSLPFYLLVGKDGKIDSIYHSRLDQERLGGRMKELLGLEELPVFAVKPKPMVIENPLLQKAAPTPNEAPPPAPESPKNDSPKTESPKTEAPQPEAKEQSSNLIGPVLARLALSAFLFLEEETSAETDEKPAEVNPYLAKQGLSSSQLTDWVLRMLDKPMTIQKRPGFAAAIAEACDRVLADKNAKEAEQLVAIENKLAALHQAACNGNDECDQQLAAFVVSLKDDARPRVARQTAFFLRERKVLDASEAKPEEIAALLKELQDFYAQEKLASKHLRMASATVDLINKLEDGDTREKHFADFGNQFAKSSDKELARYGKKLAKKPETKESDLIGKPLELAGNTAGGLPFAWDKYRGKVVVVDFWATWCGPCRKEMPNVKAFLEKNKARGFDVVGVSVDKDLEALETFLDENDLPWETLAGDEAGGLAEKYGVRAIPTMMLVDQKGNIVAVAHNIAALAPEIEKLLAANAKK